MIYILVQSLIFVDVGQTCKEWIMDISDTVRWSWESLLNGTLYCLPIAISESEEDPGEAVDGQPQQAQPYIPSAGQLFTHPTPVSAPAAEVGTRLLVFSLL